MFGVLLPLVGTTPAATEVKSVGVDADIELKVGVIWFSGCDSVEPGGISEKTEGSIAVGVVIGEEAVVKAVDVVSVNRVVAVGDNGACEMI